MTERTAVETCDVLVVGGGVLGTSIALELGRAGAGDVLLVERDAIAEGTSNAGAGIVALWGGLSPFLGPHEIALERYGLQSYAELTSLGYDFGFKRNGTLFPAATEATYQAFAEIGDAPLIEWELLDGVQVAELTGITVADEVPGGAFNREGGQVRAGDATLALADLVLREGNRIHTHRPVLGLRTSGSRVVGVDTQWGPIEASAVVLAAGAWTNQLLAGIGAWLPMVPLTASRLTTGPLGVKADMPAMLWADFAGMWMREEAGGLVWGATYSAPPHFSFIDGEIPHRFDQLPLDGLVQVQGFAKAASRAMPILARETSMRLAHGVPCFTPDRVGLVGPMLQHEGLWVAAGCNEGGVTHGPGYGRVIADLLVSGQTKVTDASRLRPNRLDDKYPTLADVTAELVADTQRVHESRQTGFDAPTA